MVNKHGAAMFLILYLKKLGFLFVFSLTLFFSMGM